MRSDSDSFSAANVARSKDVRFVIELSFADDNSVLRYFLSHDDADYPSGATAYAGVIQSFTSTSQSLDPISGNSTIGDISFTLVDADEALTTLLQTQLAASRSARKKRVRVYAGYKDLDWWDYTLLATQFVDKKVSYLDGAYTFNCSDIQREARIQIFKPKETNLGAAFSKTDTTITVVDNSDFTMVAHDASYSDAPSSTVGYLKIIKSNDEYEIVSYTGKSSTTGFTGLTRALFGTKQIELTYDVAVSADRQPKIEEFIYLEGPAVKLIYAIRTGVLYGQGGATLPSHWHLGTDTDYVRLLDFTNYGADWWDSSDPTLGFQVRFEGLKEQDGKQFVERELQLLLGAFGPIYADGAVGLKKMAGVLSSSGYTHHLTASNVVSYGELDHDYSRVHNNIEVRWNWDEVAEKFTRVNVFLDTDSQTTYGTAEKYILDFRGLIGDIHTTSMLLNQFAAIRDRYAGPPLMLEMQVLPSLNTIEVGDVVRVTLDQIRDYTGSYTTIDRTFEVQNIIIDWINQTVNLKLFGSSKLAKWVPLDATTGSAISDAYYTVTGTNLTSVLTISGGAVTANGTITGATTMASARYYYNGDLTINSGVTVTGTHNVLLFIKGSLTINGIFTMEGKGLAGAAQPAASTPTVGQTPPTANIHRAGSPGGIGVTKSGGWQLGYIDSAGLVTVGTNASIPTTNLQWNGSALLGLPHDLRGSSGSSGGTAFNRATTKESTWNLNSLGGAGGAGGGGLIIVCRGLYFGSQGKINLSGLPGNHADAAQRSFQSNFFARGGGGAGGAPGGMLVVIDGNTVTYPDITSNTFLAKYGITPIDGVLGLAEAGAPDGSTFVSRYVGTTDVRSLSGGALSGVTFYDQGDASGLTGHCRIVYIEGSQTPAADVKPLADLPTSVAAVETTNSPQTPAQNLATITVTTTQPSDTNYLYEKVYYRVTGTTPWTLAGPSDGSRTIVAAMDGTAYDIESRSVSRMGVESATGTRTTITMSNAKGGANLATGNWIASGQTAYDTGTGFYMVNESGTPKFSIGNSAGNKMTWNGTTLAVTGTITATLGAIGGWSIGTTALTAGSGATTVGLDSGGSNPAIYAGSATPGSAPFRVTQAGAVTATSGTIGGWTLASGTLTSTSGGLVLDNTNNRARFTSGSNYVEIGSSGLKGVDGVLGTTFTIPVDGSAPTFSSGVINSTTYNLTTTSVIRTSSTVGDGTASGYGVLMNSDGVKGFKASSTTPTFFLDSSDGSASFGQTTTEKYIAFDSSTGDVSVGRDTRLLGSDSYNNDNYYWTWSGDSNDGYPASTSGSGTFANENGYLKFVVTTASGDYSGLIRTVYYESSQLSWDSDRRMKFRLRFNNTPGSNQVFIIGLGDGGTNSRKAMFRVKASSLAIYGVTGDGTSETELDLSTTLSAGTHHKCELILTSSTSVAFYIDGTLKGTISTNIPTGSTHADVVPYMLLKNSAASSSAQEIWVHTIKILQDP